MRKNLTKEKLLAGETVYGLFCDLYIGMAVEMIGIIGFDFVIIDQEHNPITVETCLDMVRAADSVGITPIIRVNMNLRQHILRYLDIGAQGVQLPMVNTRSDAEAVVQAVKYPPLGLRGVAGTRSADYGLKSSFVDYVAESNQQTLVVVQIENREAMKNIDEILKVDGIDVFFVGPMDLSTSLGHPCQIDHPEVQKAIEEMVRKIKAAGKIPGTLALDVESAQRAKMRGFKYLAGATSVMLTKASKEYLAQVKVV